MKLTTAQRAALVLIQAGGVTRYVPRYGLRTPRLNVPTGARPISPHVYARIREADLIDCRTTLSAAKQPIGGERHDVILTQRGINALAGVVLPPVILTTRIMFAGVPIGEVSTKIDPYHWDRWQSNPVELARQLARVNADAIRARVTTETRVSEACT